MIGARPRAAALLAAAVAAAAPSTGCSFAVQHPAVTAGIVGGTLGFATCKLASDNYGACVGVAGGAAAFLGLVAATALWLGGDGTSAATDEDPEQIKPLPAADQPRRKRRHPAEPAPDAAPGRPPPASPAPTSPAPASPAPASPAPASPAPASPAPQ
jgi:hypothetical protein